MPEKSTSWSTELTVVVDEDGDLQQGVTVTTRKRNSKFPLHVTSAQPRHATWPDSNRLWYTTHML
jgi:hypothetical protein